jgi:dihydrofolate synthase/folylpolyglutamate synthase
VDYASAIKWLHAQLPIYQRVGKAALNSNLDGISKLAKHLGNPHQKFKSVHIAGTNGKGSSAHMLASVLQQAGYKVGLYTSPHLKDFRERIRINGIPIDRDYTIDFVVSNREFFEQEAFSFFEMTVGLAFDYFNNQQVDVAVIEVGLGGRLDATNIILPEACLITNIALDHQQFLGTTRPAIAKEKGGIIKPNIPVVLSVYDNETFAVFDAIAKQLVAPLYVADKYFYKTDLLGDYQKQNINGVITLIKTLSSFSVSEIDIVNGLQRVCKNTGMRGRWEVLGDKPDIIADVAHNKAGLEVVLKQLTSLKYDNLHIVFGMVNDKDVGDLITLLPPDATYYLCAAAVPRAMDVASLSTYFSNQKSNYSSYESVKHAYDAALNAASARDVIFVGGSLFVVSEILP